MSKIKIKNARVHNLKNVSVEIPKNKLTVITGLSGSGKSSLAFDTIYAEGQRRYAESLNSYARQFMGVSDKPDVDEILGLSPTIAIDQKNTSVNPRSTLGTVTEIYDLLRLLFSKIGTQYCPESGLTVKQFNVGEISEIARKMARKSEEMLILSPIIKAQEIKPKQLLENLERSGFSSFRLNGVQISLLNLKKYRFDSNKKYDVDIIVETIKNIKKQNVVVPVEKAIDLANGSVILVNLDTGDEDLYTTYPFCSESGKTFEPIEPRSFSFNSPFGACPRCTGLGYTLNVDPELVIPNPRLTLGEGAIQPWTRIVGNQAFYHKLLKVVSEKHKFPIDVPVKDLPKKTMDLVLYGTDGQTYEVENKTVRYEGVIPNLTQRHAETDSEYVRKEIEQYMKDSICPVCDGKRLKQDSLAVKIGDFSISDIVEMSIDDALTFLQKLIEGKTDIILTNGQKQIAEPLLKEIAKRIQNLQKVGLNYLTLDRSFATLSGGEAQRVRLASQLSTGLSEVIYVLDEPSIGLHPKDNDKLIGTLQSLRDGGNTVIVVEHDRAIIESAEYVIDVGPGAGIHGGEIMAEGTPAQIKKSNSITGQYLADKEEISIPKKYNKGNGKKISIQGAKAFNLKNIDVDIPLGNFVCVTGVSGSGKSTLITGILSKALHKHFYKSKAEPGEHKKLLGLNNIDKVISINQSPIGRTPRSNPATYTGVFTTIRDLFTEIPEAKMRGYDAGMFSFNVKGGGRCEACSGEGYQRIPMQFLNDVFIECAECEGKRYNKEALEIHYKRKNIADVLEMTVEEAYLFFREIPNIAEKLQVLRDVGLGYLHLGQPATNLSGGEAQRIKLATELSRRATGKTLYILDEPTTGLHFEDIKRLLHVLQELVKKGNTILTIEHNLDVIKCADWVIDMGPSGGKDGGNVVAEGTPKDVAKVKESFTGQYLQKEIFGSKK